MSDSRHSDREEMELLFEKLEIKYGSDYLREENRRWFYSCYKVTEDLKVHSFITFSGTSFTFDVDGRYLGTACRDTFKCWFEERPRPLHECPFEEVWYRINAEEEVYPNTERYWRGVVTGAGVYLQTGQVYGSERLALEAIWRIAYRLNALAAGWWAEDLEASIPPYQEGWLDLFDPAWR